MEIASGVFYEVVTNFYVILEGYRHPYFPAHYYDSYSHGDRDCKSCSDSGCAGFPD
jgi:hypothetical protein